MSFPTVTGGEPHTLRIASAEQLQEFGRALAGVLRAGDLVLLHGALGAGKTTLAQGIGQGLGVVPGVSSPTFVIARTHRAAAGPGLVHVDAYRLGSLEELDALDLDTSLAAAVTVVEWGGGIAEVLAQDRLEIQIDRIRGGLSLDEMDAADDAERTVTITRHGARWEDVDPSAWVGRALGEQD